MKRPEISIVILTWNRAPFLKIGLQNLFGAISPDITHEIIIMDNCSDDNTPQILSEYSHRTDVKIIRNKSNLRLNAYKRLLPLAVGRIIIEIDDDVLSFPTGFDRIFIDYFKAFPDYGYLALNVIQNEKTNGAKPSIECYRDDVRGNMVVEEGPTGGWCAAFHRTHYRLFRPLQLMLNFSMANGEDGLLSAFFTRILRKRAGIIKSASCLHATGVVFAQEFGLMKREYEKYAKGGRPDLAVKFLS